MLSRDDLYGSMSISGSRIEAFESYLTSVLKSSTSIVEIDKQHLDYYGLSNPKIVLGEVTKLRKLGYFVEVYPDKIIVSMLSL